MPSSMTGYTDTPRSRFTCCISSETWPGISEPRIQQNDVAARLPAQDSTYAETRCRTTLLTRLRWIPMDRSFFSPQPTPLRSRVERGSCPPPACGRLLDEHVPARTILALAWEDWLCCVAETRLCYWAPGRRGPSNNRQ